MVDEVSYTLTAAPVGDHEGHFDTDDITLEDGIGDGFGEFEALGGVEQDGLVGEPGDIGQSRGVGRCIAHAVFRVIAAHLITEVAIKAQVDHLCGAHKG